MSWIYRSALGQDHHRFVKDDKGKRPLILAGVDIPGPALEGNSDADVVFHALCNAISGLSSKNFLGPPADKFCNKGVIDSKEYVIVAIQDLKKLRPGMEFIHLSVSIEGKRPKLWDHIPRMKKSLSELLNVPLQDIGLTATTGEGLTGMGQGDGLACLCLLTIREPEHRDPDRGSTLPE